MAQLIYKNGITSVVLRIRILDTTSYVGKGLTGLTSSSTGLIISTIADTEATATAYTVAGSNVQTISVLGTFAAPSANKCRFAEVDSTNHPGLYEIQIADARWGVSNARSVVVTVSGATNANQVDSVIQLSALDLNTASVVASSVSGNVSGSVASVTGNVGGNVTGSVGSVTSGVTVTTNNDKTGYTASSVTGSVGSVTGNVGGNVVGSVGSVTGSVGSVTSGVTVTTNNDKTGYSLTQTFPTNFSSLAITGGGAVTAASVTGSVGSVTGAVGSVTGNVGGNVVGSVGSVSSGVTVTTNTDKTGYSLTQTFPTNFAALAVTSGGAVTVGTNNDKTGYTASSVTGSVGSVTGNVGGNVTGSVGSVVGSVGSVTGNIGGNVAGSVASVSGAVGSVTGNVGGNVTGSVGSVTSAVTAGTVTDKTGYALSASGLDSISVADPGVPSAHTTLPKMVVALWRRYFKASSLTSTQLTTYADNGTTANSKAAVSDDGSTQTVNAASDGP